MTPGHTPKFAKRYAELGDAIVDAMKSYVGEVQSGAFPAPEHAYKPNRVPEESGLRMPATARVVSLRH
jgi:ketopantoate hydroxymethyltransferase